MGSGCRDWGVDLTRGLFWIKQLMGAGGRIWACRGHLGSFLRRRVGSDSALPNRRNCSTTAAGMWRWRVWIAHRGMRSRRCRDQVLRVIPRRQRPWSCAAPPTDAAKKRPCTTSSGHGSKRRSNVFPPTLSCSKKRFDPAPLNGQIGRRILQQNQRAAGRFAIGLEPEGCPAGSRLVVSCNASFDDWAAFSKESLSPALRAVQRPAAAWARAKAKT